MVQITFTDVFENDRTRDVVRLVGEFLTLHDNFLTVFVELVHVGDFLLFVRKENFSFSHFYNLLFIKYKPIQKLLHRRICRDRILRSDTVLDNFLVPGFL